MNVSRLSDKGAAEVMALICDGLKRMTGENPESAKYLLEAMIDGFLEPVSSEDGFGTEGWEHAFGLDD